MSNEGSGAHAGPPTPASAATLGYAREGTDPTSLTSQVDLLVDAGIDDRRVYRDTATTASDDGRPGLAALLDYARPGDTVVVVGMDRLGRTPAEVLSTAHALTERGIGVRSLRERVDTTEPTGAMIVGVLASLSMPDDTTASGSAPRIRHHIGSIGRPRVLSDDQVQAAERMRANGNPVPMIASTLGVSRATLYRAFADRRATR